MTDLQALFTQYIEGNAKEQERAAKQIAQTNGAQAFLMEKLSGAQARAALALLGRAARRESVRWALMDKTQEIVPLLASEDAKTRKNAAIVLGQIGQRAVVPALCGALSKETQQFVRPSLILALGQLGGTEAQQAVKALPLPEGTDKNTLAERDAIQKALSRLAPQKSRTFTGFAAPRPVWLMPVNGLIGSLLAEARAKHIEVKQKGSVVEAVTRSLPSLYALRGFYEALLPFAVGVKAEPEALAEAVEAGGLYALLCQMHDGSVAFPTRLEVRGPGIDRAAFASKFFARVNGAHFVNSPSSYDIELRCWIKNGQATLSVRLHTFQDPRFAYRLESVPASMHPAVAAALLYDHRRYMKQTHTVLDPFCGAGTLLIERKKLMGAKAFTGLDISPKAFSIARANCHEAGLHAKVFNRDCRGFHSDFGYDEILCNLPFGHRVGSHEQNERLYDDILQQWPKILRPGGFVLAVTNDKQLFSALATRHGWKIASQMAFSAGGLSPTAFLLQR